MSDNALAVADRMKDLQAQSQYGAEVFAEIGGSSINMLPRLQLFTANSEQVKSGQIPMAEYGLILPMAADKPPRQLGKQVHCLPLAWRPKALDVNPDKPLSYFKTVSPEFIRIVQTANRDTNSGCMYGPEFLIWLPKSENFEGGYATFFMGSKTARNASGPVRAALGRPIVLTARYIKNDQYSWHGPEAAVSSQSIEGPPAADIDPVVQDFLNPQDSKPEGEKSKPEEAQAAVNVPEDR